MSKKRGNNEGSVYQMSDGRWAAAITITTAGGKKKRKFSYTSTQQKAIDKLTELRQQKKDGVPFTDERLTVEQWMKAWLRNQRPPATKPKTYIAYEYQTNKHLIPALGKCPLRKLTIQEVRDFMRERLEYGLSQRTVRHLRATLRAALNAAIADGILPERNVASKAKPPALETNPLITYNPEQARLFLKTAKDHRLAALFTTAVSLGLREGEILGLQWPDINFARRTLTVQRTLQRVKRVRLGDDPKPGERKTEVLLLHPKTEDSRRTLSLPTVLVRALEEHQKRQGEEQLLAGSAWKGTNFVFTSRIGTPLDQRRVCREFSALTTAASLPRLRFHDLRHSAASLLIAQGVHARAIMELLGHSTITLTMDTYGHLMESVNRNTAEQMDSILTPVTAKSKLRRVK